MTTTMRVKKPGYTDEQRLAVMTRGVSISLSAGAGCGKTFVLTERYLAHLDPRAPDALTPEQISQLVAITFTERAAREMRDRIRGKCHERVLAATDEAASYWNELARALDNARISTIHSFCAALLRSRAVEAGVDPRFVVLEQAQSETLLAEAIDDELRRLVAARDETTLDLAVRYKLDDVREMVRRLVVACTPEDFAVWLDVSVDDQLAVWSGCAEELAPRVGRELADSDPAQTVRRVLRDAVPQHELMRARRTALLQAIEQLQAGPGRPQELAALLAVIDESARVERAGGASSWPSEQAYATFRDAATDLRKAGRELHDVAAFDPSRARPAAELAGQLYQMADGVRRAYSRRKDELRALDFNDLLVRTRQLVSDARHRPLVDRLSSHVTLLMVDEFQDTDPVQVELVEALCGEGLNRGKLFFVGDQKQSIYRFRGADPRVFRRLRDHTPAAGQQSLSINFRSQPAILKFVNALFREDLDQPYEPLRPHRPQVSPGPAVEFLWALPEQPDAKENAESVRGREAEWIARRIRELLDSGEPIVWDSAAAEAGQPAARAARPGDVAILLRALTNVEAYEAALRDYGIDYYLVGGHAFYAQQEIFDLLNLLRALNSPADVVSLAGALRSGFFSLADETIFWLAQHLGGLAEGLFADSYPEAVTDGQRERAAFAARTVAQLRACKDRLRICELIELALSLTGYDAALLSEFLGERKLANLHKLIEHARSFQRGDFLGLPDFIAQLSEFVVRQPDEPLAATHSEDTNVVRIMSVHQAKGLEFPVVVIPDVNRPQKAPWAPALFDARLGPLVRMPFDEEPIASGYDLWRHLERSEEEAETNRLLYVATTRAADYLILSSGLESIGKTTGPWARLLARRFDLADGRFLGALPDGETPPLVKVTTAPADVRLGGSRRAKVDIDEMITKLAPATPIEVEARARLVDPIRPDLRAPRQYSFSRLSGTLHKKYEPLDEGQFADAASPDPRGLGTLVHAALAAIDFAAPVDCRQLVERLAEQHLPDLPDEAAEAAGLVERFMASARAREIAAARESRAETEFLLAWPPEGAEPGRIVLRGFIDRLYQDVGGRWHLLDFKTNRIASTNIAATAASYEMQMLLYGLAVESSLGAPPASLTLHFLRTGDEHRFAWDAAARRRVITLVNDSIQAENQRQTDG